MKIWFSEYPAGTTYVVELKKTFSTGIEFEHSFNYVILILLHIIHNFTNLDDNTFNFPL